MRTAQPETAEHFLLCVYMCVKGGGGGGWGKFNNNSIIMRLFICPIEEFWSEVGLPVSSVETASYTLFAIAWSLEAARVNKDANVLKILESRICANKTVINCFFQIGENRENPFNTAMLWRHSTLIFITSQLECLMTSQYGSRNPWTGSKKMYKMAGHCLHQIWREGFFCYKFKCPIHTN